LDLTIARLTVARMTETGADLFRKMSNVYRKQQQAVDGLHVLGFLEASLGRSLSF
jgi:hypothetical protein